ncbi:MAG: hypothetical protein IPI34_00005 [bacterium]|nr:hypothetical protein [bacterium]
MNAGFTVEYDGRISVVHHHDAAGRPNWRRYYYDTRNMIWVAVRNMPWDYAARYLLRGMLSTGLYATRDGFLMAWMKAISVTASWASVSAGVNAWSGTPALGNCAERLIGRGLDYGIWPERGYSAGLWILPDPGMKRDPEDYLIGCPGCPGAPGSPDSLDQATANPVVLAMPAASNTKR